MPEIIPFRGYQYNPQIIDNLTNVLAPPYDVISSNYRKELIHRSKYNIVNLTLAKSIEEQSDPNHYKAASELLAQWKKENIVIPTDKPCIWQVTESFQDSEGYEIERYGYLALVKLEDYTTDGIRRHERTHKAAKEDRYRLLDVTHMNFSPIFFVFNDIDRSCEDLMHNFPSEGLRTGRLDFETTVSLRIEQTSDSEWIESFSSLLSNKPLLIADGHHRYETARTYHEHQRKSSGLNSGYVLAYLVPSSCRGLQILPTHRGLHGLTGKQQQQLLFSLTELFSIESPSADSSYLNICLDDGKINRLYYEDEISSNRLDTQLFEDIILKKILKLSEDEIANKAHLMYFHRREDCLQAVNDGILQAAFIMESLTVNELMASTEDGNVLPQKSTFFFPKIGAGMVMQSLEIM